MHLLTLLNVINPHKICLHTKVKNNNVLKKRLRPK